LIAGGAGLVALVVRAVYAFTARPVLYPGTDNTWYVTVARSVADGRWGRVVGRTGTPVWTFRFPPAYPWFLAAGERVLFWVRAIDAARWASIAAGAVAAVLVARLAWRWAVAAPRGSRIVVAAVAGGVLAVGPIVAGASTGPMSESLFVAVVAGVLLAIDHLLEEDRSPGWVAVLGALLAVGSLTRVEGIVILGAPVLAALVVGRRRSVPVGRWIAALAVAVVAVGAWSTFASVETGRPVALTSNGSLQLGANCHSAQYGEAAGSWLSDCLVIPDDDLSAHAHRVLATPSHLQLGRLEPPAGPDIEAEVARMQVRAAIDRITGDPVGFLHAVPFRLARAAGVYWTPSQENLAVFEGRDRTWEAVGRWFHLLVILPLVIVAAAGLAARRSEVGRRVRRLVDPRRVVPAASLFAVWAAGVVVTYGNARLRSPVEPVLAALAGLGAGVLSLGMARFRAEQSPPR
jgi:4-amino-4-deoxy-L-arabinose transferase-like glycosyltransferase